MGVGVSRHHAPETVRPACYTFTTPTQPMQQQNAMPSPSIRLRLDLLPGEHGWAHRCTVRPLQCRTPMWHAGPPCLHWGLGVICVPCPRLDPNPKACIQSCPELTLPLRHESSPAQA